MTFPTRADAGQQLAAALAARHFPDPVVLALPRGGVPVAAEIARALHAPLDLVDGAARVYDPIVLGEQGEDLYGCFLKDYQPAPW